MVHKVELEIGGRLLTIETGKMAKQANGAVMVRYADSMVISTVCATPEPREGQDFFPLTVEYREKSYAAGKIPGGFFKREGRPSEKEILSARIIDRPIRPLFPEDFKGDTQCITYVVSHDQQNDTDILGLIGTAASLAISDVPFQHILAGVRVGRIDGQLVINPLIPQMDECDIYLTIAGTADSISMVEGGGREILEDDLVKAMAFGHDHIKQIMRKDRRAGEIGRQAEIRIHAGRTGCSAGSAGSARLVGGRLSEFNHIADKDTRRTKKKEMEKELAATLANRLSRSREEQSARRFTISIPKRCGA